MIMDGVTTLSDIIIPTLSTFLLLQFLTTIPHSPSTVAAIDELTSRELPDVVTYLLSLPYSHWHRSVLKPRLERRLRAMSVDDLQALSGFLPQLSALQYSEGEWIPVMGPLSDYDTGLWDTNDWYFRLLHARQIAGT